MIKKISAIAIMIAYSLTAFGEGFADLIDASGISTQTSISQSLQCEQPSETAQIKTSCDQPSSHHSDCADSKNCHHCSSCYCGFALVQLTAYTVPLSADKKCSLSDHFYLDVSLSSPQRPPQA